VGSNPTLGMAFGVIGNTGDFESSILGSSPRGPVKHKFMKLTAPQRRILAEKTLTAKERKGSKKALPSKDAYPIPDKEHAKNALARAKQFASKSDQATIKRNVKKEFPGLDVEMKPSKPTVKLGPTSRKKS
jgi:hypothetical protein